MTNYTMKRTVCQLTWQGDKTCLYNYVSQNKCKTISWEDKEVCWDHKYRSLTHARSKKRLLKPSFQDIVF